MEMEKGMPMYKIKGSARKMDIIPKTAKPLREKNSDMM